MDDRRAGFDATRWRSHRDDDTLQNPRIGMVAALEGGILRKGMPRAEVRDLLGPPDAIKPRADNYGLGVYSFSIDYQHYVIEYDRGGRVSRCYTRSG